MMPFIQTEINQYVSRRAAVWAHFRRQPEQRSNLERASRDLDLPKSCITGRIAELEQSNILISDEKKSFEPLSRRMVKTWRAIK